MEIFTWWNKQTFGTFIKTHQKLVMMETNLVMKPETSPKVNDQELGKIHTHFMGIEGAGMFALAELFRQQGGFVSGCLAVTASQV